MKKLLTIMFSLSFILCGFASTSLARISVEEILAKGPALLNTGNYRTVIEMVKALPKEDRYNISIQIVESFANYKAWSTDREVTKKKRWLELYLSIKDSSESGATPILLKFLEDSDARIRYYAVEFLQTLGDESAIPVLEQLSANDPHHDVRSIAEETLEIIRAQ